MAVDCRVAVLPIYVVYPEIQQPYKRPLVEAYLYGEAWDNPHHCTAQYGAIVKPYNKTIVGA